MERLEDAIREVVPEWSLAEVVVALQAVRGIDLIAAVGVLAEIGDLEAAWSYRYPPRVSRDKQPKVEAAPRHVREIAWKAQCGRFRSLERKGKRRTVIATAIARELSAFIWAINRELMAHRQA